jgi:hypothetical protein
MDRRPFIKQLGSGLLVLPGLGSLQMLAVGNADWKGSFQTLIKNCNIIPIHSKLIFDNLPPLPPQVSSGEFRRMDSMLYMYHDGKYCFQIFHKVHENAGTLELLIPFYKRRPDNGWEKLINLNQFAVTTLAHSSRDIKKNAGDALLPCDSYLPGEYKSRDGHVKLISRLNEANTMHTEIEIQKENNMFFRKTFSNNASFMV